MANNPSPNKQFNRPDKGDLDWNTPLNINFTTLDNILGTSTQPINIANVYALSSTDLDNMRFYFSGTLSADATVTIPPNIGGYWIFTNATTGAFNIRVKVTTGTNLVTIPQGYSTVIYTSNLNPLNAWNAYDALDSKLNVTGGTIAGNLTVNNVFTVGSGKLQFDATAATPVLNIGGSIVATGNVTAFGTIPSDRRLKDNIETIENALETVKKLRGVTFNMKMNGKASLGLIAQEVQEVLPSLVLEGPDEMLSVAYANIVGILVNAVQELSARVDALESK